MVKTMEKTVVKKAPVAKKTTKVAAKAASGKTLVVVQTGSTTGMKQGVIETLKGLGLGKPRARRELQDTPAVRGMVWKVRHLVNVEGE